MLVEVTEVSHGTYTPTLSAVGSVRAEKEIMLSSRVAGEIIAVADGFSPGGFVEQGEVLLRIDPADYDAALTQRLSELHQAQADFELELGRQELARGDYEELKGSISPQYETLVLRRPQLNAARARVEAAEAAVKRAELDLERTRIRAPFAAQVLTREVNLGSQVSPAETLGQLVGTDQYWVEVALPAADVSWIRFPDAQQSEGSVTRVRNRTAWPEGVYRIAYAKALIGALDSQTRLARVLVTVTDPLSQLSESAGRPPLMVGSFVEANIEGRPIENVIRLEQDYLRRNDTVWVNGNGQLEIRDVDVLFRDKTFAYIRSGLAEGEQVVMTDLATVIAGAALRLDRSDNSDE